MAHRREDFAGRAEAVWSYFIAEAMKTAVPEWIRDRHIYTKPRFMQIGHFAMLCFTEIKMLLPECC